MMSQHYNRQTSYQGLSPFSAVVRNTDMAPLYVLSTKLLRPQHFFTFQGFFLQKELGDRANNKYLIYFENTKQKKRRTPFLHFYFIQCEAD